MIRMIKSAGHHARSAPLRGVCAAALLAGLFGGSGAAMAQGHADAASVKKLNGKTSTGATKASAKSRNGGASPASAKPALVGSFGDWGVYVSQGAKSKICYALAQPKDRAPASLKREQSYVFISNRPGEGVHNEISIMMGVPLKDGATGAKAEIGSTGFDLIAKGQNAFIKNAAEEGQFVDTLKRRGTRLIIKVLPARGAMASDTYSLAGVAQALDRVSKECP